MGSSPSAPVEIQLEGTPSRTIQTDPGKYSDEYRPKTDPGKYSDEYRPKKWRQDEYEKWDDKTVENLKTAIKESLKPLEPVDEIEIIVCGGTSHGKSSLINNCVTALNGHYCQVADLGSGREQITKQYKNHQAWQLENGNVKKLPLVFADTRGFSDSKKLGAPVAAIKACIMGKVVNGETIDPKITDQEWSKRKPKKSKVSHIVFVADATTIPDKIPSDRDMMTIYKNLRQIREFSRTEDIPVAAFITKCDMLDPSVENDLSRLYFSEKVESKVRMFSQMVDIAENRVFPVVNYTKHNNASNGMMVQTLLALKECLIDIMARFCSRRN